MTLHEAIRNVILSFGELSFSGIATKINKRRLYVRKDGQPVSPSQIAARIAQYPELFSLDKNDTVSIKNSGLISLKIIIEKIADILDTSKSNPVYLKELILPTIAIYLKESDPVSWIQKLNTSTHSPISLFIEELESINKGNLFLNLLDTPIKLLSELEESIQVNILNAILSSFYGNRNIKYVAFDDDNLDLDTLDFEINLYKEFNKAGSYTDKATSHLNWKIEEEDFRSFFDTLINEFSWKNKFQTAQSTPKAIINLIAKIAKPKDEQYVLDPFIGKGSLMLELSKQSLGNNLNIIGGDINENSIILLKLLFAVNKIKIPNVLNANSFLTWKDYPAAFDWFISDPPMGLKIATDSSISEVYGKSRNGIDAIIKMALYHIHSEGIACVVVPESFIFSTNKSTKLLRKELVDKNFLAGIISLPPGIYAPYSQVKTSLIIIDKSRTSKHNFFTFTYDAANTPAREFERIIPDIIEEYGLRNTEYFNSEFFVPIDVVASKDYNFSIPLLHQKTNKFADSPGYLKIYEILPSLENQHNYTKESPSFGEVHYSQRIAQSGIPINKRDLNNQSGIPYFQISDLSDDPINCTVDENTATKFVISTEFISPKYAFKNNILIAKSGTKLKPSIYKGDDKALFSSNIVCLQLDINKVLPEYFVHQLHEQYFFEQVSSIRQGVSLLNFRIEDFLNLSIFVPQLSEQQILVEEFFKKKTQKEKDAEKDDIDHNLYFMISSIKHGVQTPLSSIKGDIESLNAFFESSNDGIRTFSPEDYTVELLPGQSANDIEWSKVKNILFRIANSVADADKTLKKAEEILNIGHAQFRPENIKIKDFVTKEILPFYTFSTMNIELTGKEEEIEADAYQLSILFKNLLENAQKHGFSKEFGKGKKKVIIQVDKTLEPGMIRITVMNNGLPFNSQFNRHLFETKGETTNRQTGSGFGGYHIKKIIQNHSGKIEIAEDTEIALTEFKVQFKIYLPQKISK